MTERYAIGQMPDECRQFTTQDIAMSLGLLPTSVSSIAVKLGIKPERRYEGRAFKHFYSWEQFRQLQLYEAEIERKRAKLNKVNVQVYTLEELKKLHPLVTDDRFFQLSYFPETKPKCFEDY